MAEHPHEPLDPGERRSRLLYALLSPAQRNLYLNSAHFKTMVDILIDRMLPAQVAGLEQDARAYDEDRRRAMERAMRDLPPISLPGLTHPED